MSNLSNNHTLRSQINDTRLGKKMLGMRKMKQLYFELFQQHNEPNDEWWAFRHFCKCCNIIDQYLNNSFGQCHNVDKREIIFKCNQTLYNAGQRVILTLGPPNCDIPLDIKTDSTTGATIFIFYSLKKLVILDTSSIEIVTKFRESGMQCISSFPNNKQLILLELFEFCIIQINGIDLTINPVVRSTSPSKKELNGPPEVYLRK